MCTTCSGIGIYVTEPIKGVYQSNLCKCEESKARRETNRKGYEDLPRRLELVKQTLKSRKGNLQITS